MTNIPLTKSEVDEILNKLCIENTGDLFKIIPKKFKFDANTLSLNDSLSEKQLTEKFNNISNKNLSSNNSLFFMGGGVYNHYVPKIVDTIKKLNT